MLQKNRMFVQERSHLRRQGTFSPSIRYYLKTTVFHDQINAYSRQRSIFAAMHNPIGL